VNVDALALRPLRWSRAMDPLDAFYQQLDCEQILLSHCPALLAHARRVLAASPGTRLAGLIASPDSRDAETVRQVLAAFSGQEVSGGQLLVGIVPRGVVEALITSGRGELSWREDLWQAQQVLPVVVSIRDGFEFAFLGLGHRDDEATGTK
jgi:hypothetical protein